MGKLSAIFETKDKQLIPLDDIQHINGRYNEALKDGYQTLTILYKDGMKMIAEIVECGDHETAEKIIKADSDNRKRRVDIHG